MKKKQSCSFNIGQYKFFRIDIGFKSNDTCNYILSLICISFPTFGLVFRLTLSTSCNMQLPKRLIKTNKNQTTKTNKQTTTTTNLALINENMPSYQKHVMRVIVFHYNDYVVRVVS